MTGMTGTMVPVMMFAMMRVAVTTKWVMAHICMTMIDRPWLFRTS